MEWRSPKGFGIEPRRIFKPVKVSIYSAGTSLTDTSPQGRQDYYFVIFPHLSMSQAKALAKGIARVIGGKVARFESPPHYAVASYNEDGTLVYGPPTVAISPSELHANAGSSLEILAEAFGLSIGELEEAFPSMGREVVDDKLRVTCVNWSSGIACFGLKEGYGLNLPESMRELGIPPRFLHRDPWLLFLHPSLRRYCEYIHVPISELGGEFSSSEGSIAIHGSGVKVTLPVPTYDREKSFYIDPSSIPREVLEESCATNIHILRCLEQEVFPKLVIDRQ